MNLPVIRPEPWMVDALCREVDPELFFPEKGEKDQSQLAKRVCALCGVRPECLEYALRRDERFGVYGGVGARTRLKMARGTKDTRPGQFGAQISHPSPRKGIAR